MTPNARSLRRALATLTSQSLDARALLDITPPTPTSTEDLLDALDDIRDTLKRATLLTAVVQNETRDASVDLTKCVTCGGPVTAGDDYCGPACLSRAGTRPTAAPSPLESSPDAAADWDLDAQRAERARVDADTRPRR